MATISPEQKSKSARLSCRIRTKTKEQAEVAAQLLGVSITDFAESALQEKARRVIAENDQILISERAFKVFITAVSSTPEKPSAKILAAVEAYRAHAPVTRRP